MGRKYKSMWYYPHLKQMPHKSSKIKPGNIPGNI